jgi:hypothetical protein
VIAVVLVVALEIDSRSPSSSTQQASAYVRDHGAGLSTVQALVENAMSGMAVAVNSPTTSNTGRLAWVARETHDAIASVRRELVRGGKSSRLGGAEGEVLMAASDLKRMMGALVAYTVGGFRSPLADFVSRYQRARREWNDGVQRIWSVAEQQTVPSIP